MCNVFRRFIFPRCVNLFGSKSIHTSGVRFDLLEFFEKPENIKKRVIVHGRPWNLCELRLKSNVDLHKLWYVLLKERNMLLTMEELYRCEAEVYPSPERIDKVYCYVKVEESMENILSVVNERDVAVNLLETGKTGLRLPYRRYTSFGKFHMITPYEHIVPWYLNGPWKLRWHSKKRPEWSKYYNQCFMNLQGRKRRKLRGWIEWMTQEQYRMYPQLERSEETTNFMRNSLRERFGYRPPMSTVRIRYRSKSDEWTDAQTLINDTEYDGSQSLIP